MAHDPAVQHRRLFFALWPDRETADRLDGLGQQLHVHCGGRRMRRDNLHLTLAFIGDVPVDRIESLRSAAAAVSGDRFSLQLDKRSYWRHNKIVWAGCEQAPYPLLTLAGQLTERITDAGFPLDARDFAAHVTLLRDARCGEFSSIEPIDWKVADFVLAASRQSAGGSHYEIIGRWPLEPATSNG